MFEKCIGWQWGHSTLKCGVSHDGFIWYVTCSQSVSHLLSALLPAAARTLLQDLRLVLALVLILRGGAAGGGLGGGRARSRRGGESSTLYLLTATGHVCHLWSVVSLLSWSAGPLWTVGDHDTQPVRLLLLYGSASWGATVTSLSMLLIIFDSFLSLDPGYASILAYVAWPSTRLNWRSTGSM